MKILTDENIIKVMSGTELVNLECYWCHKIFTAKKTRVIGTLNELYGRDGLKYCSRKCMGEDYKTKNNRITCECLQCKKNFERTKGQVKRGKNKFCSSSCAAIYNNKAGKGKRKFGPERVIFTHCKIEECGKLIGNDNTFCPEHKLKKSVLNQTIEEVESPKIKQQLDKTIKEVESSTRIRASRFSSIRDSARRAIDKAEILKACLICGYDTVVQVCHLKSISSFPPETKISEVNSLENLVCLCPNHHWEMDHGKLSQENVDKIKNRNMKDNVSI